MTPRVVLDTQIWLDWLHFDDPRCTALDRMHAEGRIELCIDPRCREELLRVLAYPAFGLDSEAQGQRLARVDQRTVLWPAASESGQRKLPRCRDPDDQKFVELSVACGARALLSRDQALLALHRRLLRDFALCVLPAERLVEAFSRLDITADTWLPKSPTWN